MSEQTWVRMTHPDVPGSKTDVPDSTLAVGYHEARGWVAVARGTADEFDAGTATPIEAPEPEPEPAPAKKSATAAKEK